jgi:hypothetical protein
MRKFELKINYSPDFMPTRNYLNYILPDPGEQDEDDMVSDFDFISLNAESLKIECWNIVGKENSKIIGKLNELKMIKNITFEECYDQLQEFPLSTRLTLNSLKSLIFINSRFSLRIFGSSRSLEKLTFEYPKSRCEIDLAEVADFIAQQDNLKELTLNVDDFDTKDFRTSNQILGEVKLFNLKKLSLRCSQSFRCPDFLKNCINLQQLRICGKLSLETYKIIINDLKNLKVLSVHSNLLFLERYRGISDLPSNNNIETLITTGVQAQGLRENSFSHLLKHMPNLKKIDNPEDSLTIDQWSTIANSMKQLKTFKFTQFHQSPHTFPTVTSISIGNFENQDRIWNQIVKTFPKVESLEIRLKNHNMTLIDEKAVNLMAENWPNLKFVKFGRLLMIRLSSLNHLLMKCPLLKKIIISFNDSISFDMTTLNEDWKIFNEFVNNGLHIVNFDRDLVASPVKKYWSNHCS